MSYLNPYCGSEWDSSEFQVKPFNYPQEVGMSPRLIFNLPGSLEIDGKTFPGSGFDYFNPLIITAEISAKIEFSVKEFVCSEIVLPLSLKNSLNVLVRRDQKTCFAYTERLGILYPSMKVVFGDRLIQICTYLKNLRSEDNSYRQFCGVYGYPNLEQEDSDDDIPELIENFLENRNLELGRSLLHEAILDMLTSGPHSLLNRNSEDSMPVLGQEL